MTIVASTPMRQVGDLPRATWLKELAGSPMLATVDAIMAAASPYGALCLCQAKRESSYGRDATAQAAHNAWGIMPVHGTLKYYDSWAAGAAGFKRILTDETIYPPHEITLLDFVRTYVGGPLCRTTQGRVCADSNASGVNPKYLVSLVADLNALGAGLITPAPAPTPTPTPTPPAPVDPIRVIVGGSYPPITYGFRDDVGIRSYVYGVGHGTTAATQHTGDDVPVGLGTTLFTPCDGTVLCVGTAGQNTWGQGCGAYNDDMTGGPGNLTILFDGGSKLTLGHCGASFVRPGDHVVAGQRVGKSGGSNGAHVHVEVAVNRNGTYWLVEPIAALRQAMGGVAPVVYPDRLDLSQPDETPPWWVVQVTADSVPVLQYGDAAAPAVAPPLVKGETFNAQYTLPGTDGAGYWISTRRGRVPVTGTERVKVVTE